jgi:hypothetical protein
MGLRDRRNRRWLLGLVVAGLGLARADASAQVQTVANLIVGDGVMVVKAGAGRRVLVGVGSSTRTATLTFAAPAVDQFVSEAHELLRLGARPLPPHAPDHAVLEEPANARALSLSRHLQRRAGAMRAAYHFFISDERLAGFTLPATPIETRAILLALHRAARAANTIGAAADSSRGTRPSHGGQAPAAAPAAAPTHHPG